MKIGVSINLDVTKLDKSKFYIGKKGTYASLTTFINLDEQDKFGNNGGVQQAKEKGSQEKMPYIGNVKIFWRDQQPDSTIDPEEIPF